MKIPIKRLYDKTIVPKSAYVGDGACDLFSCESIKLKPFERVLVGTGIALELPLGVSALVIPRSGLAIKQGLSIVNSPGLIDSNYRGEIKVIAINLDPINDISIHEGDRIAQLMIIKNEQPEFTLVDSLSDSERGEGGFGSSGV